VREAAIAELMAALSVGERQAARRAHENVALAPDPARAGRQRAVAERERHNADILEARVRELGSDGLTERFEPFFGAFMERTQPEGWLEAQTFHYVGDALVSDFADALTPLLDPVSAELIRATLADRADQDAFALDEITSAIDGRPEDRDRVAAYTRRVVGEALTQTRRALDESRVLRELLGDQEGEKRLLLDMLDRHRARLDRLGIEPVEE
jgi:tRNA-(MS[2]IO[6]A)-hydroxylase (MiaE)-like